jgi:anthranilate synthase component 2
LPNDLQVTATASDGEIMGLAHRTYPVFGLQFHPESVLTEAGYDLLRNFLEMRRSQRLRE